MPRIAAVLASSPPMRFVGGELATHAFLRHMKGRGWDVTVHCQQTPMPYMWDGLRVVPYQDGQPIFGDVLFTHPDVRIHARQVADRNGLPLVYYVHNTDPYTGESMQARPGDLTLFNSAATRDAHTEACGVTGPVMVPHVRAVDTRPSTNPRDMLGAVNLAVSKGGMSMMYLAREMRQHRFLMIRGGHGIQNVPDRGLFSHVTVLDPIMPAHMPDRFYSRLRLLFLLSHAESYGMAGLEAFWSGIPVIASDLPGVREALGEAAVYVRPGDWAGAKDWADILLSEPRLYREQQARALTRAEAQRHESHSGFGVAHALLEHLTGGV